MAQLLSDHGFGNFVCAEIAQTNVSTIEEQTNGVKILTSFNIFFLFIFCALQILLTNFTYCFCNQINF